MRRANTTNDDVQGVLVVDMDGSDNVTYAPLAKDASVAATNTTLGTTGDAAWTTGPGTAIQLLKAVVGKLAGTLTVAISGTPTVTVIDSVPLSVSATALPLPTGAALDASVTGVQRATTLNTGQVNLPTAATAVQIRASTVTRNICSLRNIGTVDLAIGAAGVTSTTGYLLHQGESYDTKYTGALWAVAPSGTPTVAFLEEVQ